MVGRGGAVTDLVRIGLEEESQGKRENKAGKKANVW